MKVTAYICDHCERLVPEDEAVGVSMVIDIFDKQKSFASMGAAMADAHYCVACYSEIITAANTIVYRQNNESLWKERRDELAFMLRQSCVKKANRKKV